MTRAPAAFTTWITISPTPPTPSTTAVSPIDTPDSRAAWTAVMPPQLSRAASSKDTESGSGDEVLRGTAKRPRRCRCRLKPSWPTGSVHT